jgi:hypothetical protein
MQRELAALKKAVSRIAVSPNRQSSAAALGYSSSDSHYSGVVGAENSASLRAYAQAAKSSTFPSAGPFEQVNNFKYDSVYMSSIGNVHFAKIHVIVPMITDRTLVVLGEDSSGVYYVIDRQKPSLDIAAATSKHYPVAALCAVGASGTGNVNAQLGKVESFYIAEAVTLDVLNDGYEEHQSVPAIFSNDKHLMGTGDLLQIGVPVPGLLNLNDPLDVLGSSAQRSSGAVFTKLLRTTVVSGDLKICDTQIPLNYNGRIKLSLNLVFDVSASPNFNYVYIVGDSIGAVGGVSGPAVLWTGYVERGVSGNADRGTAVVDIILDLDDLVDNGGDPILNSLITSLYFKCDNVASVLFGSFSIELVDYVPGVDDQCLTFRHTNVGPGVALHADLDCYSSFQHTVDNAFSNHIGGSWLPTSEHCAMQQRLLAGDVLTEALKVGKASFFKNLWKGVSRVGKSLIPILKPFAKEIGQYADNLVPGAGGVINHALGNASALGYRK